MVGSNLGHRVLEIFNIGERKKIESINWNMYGNADDAHIYACQFDHSGRFGDKILAGAGVRNEMRLFGKDLVYKPEWTVCSFRKGVYSLDWGKSTGGIMAFGGGDCKLMLSSYQE